MVVWPAFDAALLLSHVSRKVLAEDLNVLTWAGDGLDNELFSEPSLGQADISAVQTKPRQGVHHPRAVRRFSSRADPRKHLNESSSGYYSRLANVSDWSRGSLLCCSSLTNAPRTGTYHYSAEFGIKSDPPPPPPPRASANPDIVSAVGTLLVVAVVAGVWGYKAYKRRREGAIQLQG